MRLLAALVVISIICTTQAMAEVQSMPLLAVRQIDGNSTGATAELTLEIQQGTGRVYLDTYPLTKVDTQISTRFARDIACNYINVDCDKYDFFYTIKAGSSIVGGPSAGAAMAALTVAMLKGLEFDGKTTITGTINSGGLVGAVGGLKEKIQAAAEIKIEKVVIPRGEGILTQGNKTVDLKDYGKSLGIEVVEAATLNEVMKEFTGKTVKEERQNLTVDENYLGVMKILANQLCERSKYLASQAELSSIDALLMDNYNSTMLSGKNLTNRAEEALKNRYYYAAASYCFGANVKFQQVIQKQTLRNNIDLTAAILNFSAELRKEEAKLESRTLRTISDLQAYIVVSERLEEAGEQLELATTRNQSQSDYVAYAIERIHSARSWSEFFGQQGKDFNIDDEILQQSCFEKIAEAEESYQYVSLFIPELLSGSLQEIGKAYAYSKRGKYALCLAKASIAKAESNSVLGLLAIDEGQVNEILRQKIDVVKDIVIEQAEENAFPILGYSYWEYAKSLADHDKYSALLYLEYSLELSNLDIYFEREKSSAAIGRIIEPAMIWIFFLGLSTGMLLGIIIQKYKTQQAPPKRCLSGKRGDRKPSRSLARKPLPGKRGDRA
ncbi:MAG: S16 family serine protease [Candidatus Woesearchaeota archaeon]